MKRQRKSRNLCKEYKVPFVMNDNVELAVEIGADGVHVGQSDMEAGDVRAKLGDQIKLSVFQHRQWSRHFCAGTRGADYLGVGAVFPTRFQR